MDATETQDPEKAEVEAPEGSSESEPIPGDHLESLLKDYAEWREGRPGAEGFKLEYDEEEDAWEVTPDDTLPTVLVYASEIDSEFYGDSTAVFVECQLGPPDPSADLSKVLLFCGEEMVLSRLSLREEDDEPIMVVEGALPYAQAEFEYLDVLIREVAAIGADLKDFLDGKAS